MIHIVCHVEKTQDFVKHVVMDTDYHSEQIISQMANVHYVPKDAAAVQLIITFVMGALMDMALIQKIVVFARNVVQAVTFAVKITKYAQGAKLDMVLFPEKMVRNQQRAQNV